MKTLTETIRETPLADRVFNEVQLQRVLGGSSARSYGLVNRALKAGELLRVKRGLYVLADRYRDQPIHLFVVAQALVPGSYVSLENALAHHGWIPEAVYTVASILPGRKSQKYDHKKLGSFEFFPLAVNKEYFLELVAREQYEGQTMLLAKPARALLDLVCLRKQSWQGMEWLTEGLRIEEDSLRSITRAEFETLKLVYKHKRMLTFISELSRAVGND